MPRRAPRNVVLKVRLSESERDRLAVIARSADKTIADLIRSDSGRLTVRDVRTERERIAMLNRINANLNMIARWVNTHRGAADTVQVLVELAAVERAVRELVERHDT